METPHAAKKEIVSVNAPINGIPQRVFAGEEITAFRKEALWQHPRVKPWLEELFRDVLDRLAEALGQLHRSRRRVVIQRLDNKTAFCLSAEKAVDTQDGLPVAEGRQLLLQGLLP